MIEKHKEKILENYLVSGACTGDRASLAQLVALRSPRLLAHAVRLLGEREGAEDIVQEAWIDIFRGISRLRETSAFLPWALRIVSRKVATVIKRRQKERRLNDDYAHEAETEIAPAHDGVIDGERVRLALECLSKPQAACVALFYLEELSVAEVAQAMDVPVGTVKTRLMHARTKLRSLLEGESHGQD